MTSMHKDRGLEMQQNCGQTEQNWQAEMGGGGQKSKNLVESVDALRDKMGSHSPVANFLLCVKFHPIYHVAIVKTCMFSNSA